MGWDGYPALTMVCIPKTNKTKVNAIGSAFVCVENMVLEALEQVISSCIVGRGEDTFNHPYIQELWNE